MIEVLERLPLAIYAIAAILLGMAALFLVDRLGRKRHVH